MCVFCLASNNPASASQVAATSSICHQSSLAWNTAEPELGCIFTGCRFQVVNQQSVLLSSDFELQPKTVKGSHKLTKKHCHSAQQCVDLDVLSRSQKWSASTAALQDNLLSYGEGTAVFNAQVELKLMASSGFLWSAGITGEHLHASLDIGHFYCN